VRAWNQVRPLRPAVLCLALAGLLCIGCSPLSLTVQNHNTLAIGEQATVAKVEVALQPPVELDSLSKAEVLELRKEAVARYPALLAGDYEPAAPVFQLGDGLPWWGMQGQFYFGPGPQSIDGPAEESRFLLNPYLLVAAEFRGLSIWSDGDRALAWDRARITAQDLARPDFPFYCPPSHLRWWPSAARAEVTYDVSRCLVAINRWALQPLGVAQADFDLIAYNARDMNLNYIYLSLADSQNLSKRGGVDSPVAIPQYLHPGHSCGYPGGCNNMSPHTPEIEGVSLERLPAQATIWLWDRKPRSSDQPPDLVFILHFQ
jgi:hypothetical protein